MGSIKNVEKRQKGLFEEEEGVKMAFAVKRDNKELKRFKKESEAFAYLHKIQPSSVSHATTYEGYKIEEVKKPKNSYANSTFISYSDAGHGWVAVPVKLLQELGIDKQITSYSYLSHAGTTAYLEEDNDATLFSKAYKEKYGKDFAYEERIHDGSSPIRRYPSYKVLSPEEKKKLEELRKELLNSPSQDWSKKAIRKIKRASKEDLEYWRTKY